LISISSSFDKRLQAQVQDGVGLHLSQLEALDQLGLGVVLEADDADHLVEVEVGDQVAVQHLQAVLDLLQAELRAPHQDDLAVLQPLLQHVAQRQHARNLAAGQHVHVEREAHLQLGQLEEALHQQRRIDGAALRLQDQAHGLGRFVAHVAQQRQALLAHQLGDALDQLGLLHLVGNFCDDDLVGAASGVFLVPPGAQAEAAAARLVGLDDGIARLDDDAAGREVGTGHELDQLLDGGVRMFDQMQNGGAQFIGVVRRDAGRHADRNAGRAVGEQVREVGGQDRRLLLAPVVVGAEVYGVLVDTVEQLGGDLGQARLRVAVGGRVIAVDVAEVALAVDQRVAPANSWASRTSAS
jgi:hypothetical protein